MKLLPIERYTLLTKLSPKEIKSLLEANVEPRSTGLQIRIGWSGRATSKPYQGRVEDNRFIISRVINYRNSFLPEITGEVSHEIVHTAVKIRMELSWFVRVFMALWFGGVTLGLVVCIGATIREFNAGGKLEPFLAAPVVMLVFGYLLVTLGFRSEVSKSRKFLRELLQGWEDGQAGS